LNDIKKIAEENNIKLTYKIDGKHRMKNKNDLIKNILNITN
jgi:hypothetical protein